VESSRACAVLQRTAGDRDLGGTGVSCV